MSKSTITLVISSEKQKKLINWFIKQNQELKLKVFKEKKNQFFKLKNLEKNLSDEEIDYLSFIKAIDNIYIKLNDLNRKNKNNDLKSIEEISKLELLSFKKDISCEKRDAILNKISIITALKDANFSWRKISNIFKVKYRIDVSHTYLKNIYEGVNKNGI